MSQYCDRNSGEPVTEARISRCRGSISLGVGISLTGPDLLQLGIDPVETDVVEARITDGTLQLASGEGEPVIVESAPPPGVKERWEKASSMT